MDYLVESRKIGRIHAMHDASNFDDLNLGVTSTLQDLPLWEVCLELESPGEELTKLFEQQPLMPGVLLTRNQNHVGMISRRKFFEYMSRPYSNGLFSGRAIEYLYNVLQPENFVLASETLITTATEMALQRTSELLYEPILLESQSGIYGILDFQHLLLAHSRIYTFTLAQLQQAQEETKRASIHLRELEENYTILVESEKKAVLEEFVAGVVEEIHNPVNFMTGNIIHLNRYVQQLMNLINMYQKEYPEATIEIQTVSNEIQANSLSGELPKLITSIKSSAKRIQETVRSLRSFSANESDKKVVEL
jgi:signal transduction histidine kinase